MARIPRTDDARDDLTALWLFISQDNLQAADRFVDKIEHTLHLIADYPHIGEAVDHLRAGTRRFSVGNYLLFYELIPHGIRLLRVYHASRRYEDLFQ